MYTQKEINKWCDQGKMILCFDLDGTICEFGFKNGLHDCTPKHDIINRIRLLHATGDIVVIYTGRPEETREETENWLKDNGVPYQYIVFGKPKAHIYIDDSTVDVDDYIKNPEKHELKFLEKGNAINKLIRDGQ